eukprot:1072257-Pelagomonas_calceolata.AAC.2
MILTEVALLLLRGLELILGPDAWRCVCPNLNKAGRLMVELAAAATSMAITTGRAPGDYGQPLYVGYYKDRSGRPDHILLSPALYK